jgi:hypothetical protein
VDEMTKSTREDAYPAANEKKLKQPHERDESTESMEPGTDRIGEQAYDDLASGQVDTDLRGQAEQIIERAKDSDPGKPASEETAPTRRR